MALYKRPNSKYWWFKFTFNGKLEQQSTRVSNKRDAATIESAYRTQLALGKLGIKPKKEAPTFKKASDDFLVWAEVYHAEESTLRREKAAVRLLANYFGKVKVDAFEAKDIEKFVTWRSKQISKKTGLPITRGTVNREMITLKKIFKRLMNDEVISSDPTAKVKLLKENDAEFHVITDHEEKIYLMACPQPLQDIATIILETGMRCGEVYRIRRDEVFLGKNFLKVTKGKTKASIRNIHLTARTRKVLQCRLDRFKGDFLFPKNDEDFRPAMVSVEKAHRQTINDIGMSFRLYDCRHTFATRAIENGMNELTLSLILGHNGLKTVTRYAHPSEEFKADAMKKMESRKKRKQNSK